MAPKPWQDATVEKITVETPEAKTFRLALPEPIEFVCGQYVNIRFDLPDKGRVQRAYSIDSSPTHQDFVDLTIRRIEEGTISRQMCDEVDIGSTVETRGPFGRFTWVPADGGPLLLIGAGSGVVPLMCIIRYCDDMGIADIPITLLFSSKSWDYIIHRDELAEYEAKMPNLEVIHTLTREPDCDKVQYHRRIDREMIEAHLPTEPLCYLCGPPQMCEGAVDDLEVLGVDPDRIFVEKYD